MKHNKSRRKSTNHRMRSNPKRGGSVTSAKPFQMYALPEGASSFRDAAIINQNNMNNTQQKLISQHGGLKRNTRKYKTRKYNTRKYNTRKHNTRKHKKIYTKKGGSIVVPSFTQGSNVSPLNPTSLSITGNQTALQANANAANDCYATNSCPPSQTGGFRNWYDAFPPGSFGKSLTGGTRQWGCMSGGFTDRNIAGKRINMRDRFPHSGYSAGHWSND
jgi:hypothetical protein